MPTKQTTPEPPFESLANLLLERRLEEYGRALEARRNRLEDPDAGGTTGAMGRALLVNAWTEVFDDHCEQVLTDIVGLTRTFAELAAADWLVGMLTVHLDDTIAALLAALETCYFAGVGSTSAERKRVTNRVSRVKARVCERLAERIDQAAAREQETISIATSPDELDDRLPLSRAGTFDRDLAEMAEKARRAMAPLALVMIDIDHFKSVNDRHGHPVGDEVLVEVAECVVERSAGKGKAYRYGGEEFALLLPGYSAEEAVGMAERIRKDIEARFMSSMKLQITASFGVSSVDDSEATAKALLKRADSALYRAKNAGRNRVRAEGSNGPVSWSLS